MRKLTAAAFAVGAVGLAAAPALAGGSQPGTPGEPRCHGQTVAYLAQLAGSAGISGANGLGGLARYLAANGDSLSVPQLQQIADQYCTS